MAVFDIPRSRETEIRTGSFVLLLLLINFVMDGLPKAGSTLQIQLALLPITLLFLALIGVLLFGEPRWWGSVLLRRLGTAASLLWTLFILECAFLVLFAYQVRHFGAFGYQVRPLADFLALTAVVLGIGMTIWRSQTSPIVKMGIYLALYAVGQVLSILSFPLNYLRSDMLPVIFWADRALLSRQNPYQHFYVADRIYDFPYLPGTLLAFAPAQALHIDLRWAAIAYIVVAMYLVYAVTLPKFQQLAAGLIGLFVLSPYLQYRHELYTQGHFLSLVGVFVLMHKRRYDWAAAVFGVSMVISQFSWVFFPFYLLNALRRGGWIQVWRTALIAGAVGILLMAPFLASGAGNIAHNAVGQWDRLERPIARPINLSFWASYVVRPSHLKWVQLALLSAMFSFCWARDRCGNLVDTLRWITLALVIFILFNVLVDGYFYLMLLVPMLVYTCVANGWWGADEGSAVFAPRVLSEPLTGVPMQPTLG